MLTGSCKERGDGLTLDPDVFRMHADQPNFGSAYLPSAPGMHVAQQIVGSFQSVPVLGMHVAQPMAGSYENPTLLLQGDCGYGGVCDVARPRERESGGDSQEKCRGSCGGERVVDGVCTIRRTLMRPCHVEIRYVSRAGTCTTTLDTDC